jgi:hypothetical protein
MSSTAVNYNLVNKISAAHAGFHDFSALVPHVPDSIIFYDKTVNVQLFSAF